MNAWVRVIGGVFSVLVAGLLAGCSSPEARTADTWSPKAAAAYLDRRAEWWTEWPRAARDHGTFCISCHTALPYAMARGALREPLANATPSSNERKLLDNVTTRVRLWKEVGPYYGARDGGSKASESRGTEAVLNALVLASRAAETRRLSEDARHALDNLWPLQQTTGEHAGAWPWLQFGLSPWEGSDAQYYGAALAALAVGMAPENYRSSAAIHDNLELLRAYLDREYSRQPLSNRVVVLWASTKLPGLLDQERARTLVREILAAQRPDGGWSLAALARSPGTSALRSYVRSLLSHDGTPHETSSDGYATGLVTFVLMQTGTPQRNFQLQEGLCWLVRNQDRAEGSWPASSLNAHRDPSSDVGRFMTDAATAYAVLALTEANRAPHQVR
jgi:squalene-hopene/tetraprenyl-beta-curcumene cyclase